MGVMKSKSLPDELRQAIPPDVWLLGYLRADQSGDPDALKIYSERLVEVRKTKLLILLNHYGIDPNDDSCWYKLSMSLACDHVHGFQFADGPRGRPHKPRQRERPNKPGAPRKWTRDHYEIIIDLHRKGVALLGKQKGQRITQEAAMRAGACWIVEQQGLDWKQDKIRRLARAWAKRLSGARKSVQKSSEK